MPGWLLFFTGQFEAALEPFQRMYAMLPDNPASRGLYAIVLIYNGRQQEAFVLIDQLAGGEPPHVLGRLGLFWKFALQGKKPEALAEVTPELRAVAGRDITFSWLMATGFAILKDKDQALDWLETAVRLGFINYPFSRGSTLPRAPARRSPFARLMDKVPGLGEIRDLRWPGTRPGGAAGQSDSRIRKRLWRSRKSRPGNRFPRAVRPPFDNAG
jgi:hypothetical protein